MIHLKLLIEFQFIMIDSLELTSSYLNIAISVVHTCGIRWPTKWGVDFLVRFITEYISRYWHMVGGANEHLLPTLLRLES